MINRYYSITLKQKKKINIEFNIFKKKSKPKIQGNNL